MKSHIILRKQEIHQDGSWLDLSSKQGRERGHPQWGPAKTLRSASRHPGTELEQDKPPLLKAPSKAEIPTALPRDSSLKPGCSHLKTLALAMPVSVSTPKAAEPRSSPPYEPRLWHLATMSPLLLGGGGGSAFGLFWQTTGSLSVKTASTRTYPFPLVWTLFFSDTEHCWSPRSQLVVK